MLGDLSYQDFLLLWLIYLDTTHCTHCFGTPNLLIQNIFQVPHRITNKNAILIWCAQNSQCLHGYHNEQTFGCNHPFLCEEDHFIVFKYEETS